MSEEIIEESPKIATLTIGDSTNIEDEKWSDENQGAITAKADSESSITDLAPIIGAELKILNLFSGIEAEPQEVKILDKADNNPANYIGQSFRSPEDTKKDYKKLLWTDSLWPCGGLTFFFDVVSCARPKNRDKVADGFYIPKLKFVPVSKWAIPGCKLTADLVIYDPIWSKNANGQSVATVVFDVDVHLIKLKIFDWKSRIRFSLASDSTEIKLLNDPLPTPF